MGWRERRQARKERRAAARAPKPLCGEKGWRSWMYCDLPEGHDGMHGTITGTRTSRGAFIVSESVTREMW